MHTHTAIKLDKEDIKTTKYGEIFVISVKDDFDIIFSREALIELFNDFRSVLYAKQYPENKPLCCETGDFDGMRSNLCAVTTDKHEKHIARLYETKMDGLHDFTWFTQNDFEIYDKVISYFELNDY